MRRAITAFFRFSLRVFFRRIEIVGLERVPAHGAVMFAVNHPNGLVDPLFLLCFAPRPVSFLAKAPLFHTFFIGWFVRAFDSIPVYRKQDHVSGSNEETFARARALLATGGSIAIFPEGTTHDDPQMRELKTGAARIALGAAVQELSIVPTGIYYTAKQRFRSQALVVFGEPVAVRGDVEELTSSIDAGLDAITLHADSHEALKLIAQAEDIFTADEEQPLAEELSLRRRFVEGYHALRERDPARLERLRAAIVQFDAELRRANLDVHELRPRIRVGRLLAALVLLPLALIGAIVSYPPYWLIGQLAKRFSRGERVLIATIKFVAALLFYPLTYLVVAIVAGVFFGLTAGVVTGLALPLFSYAALRVFEDIDSIIGRARALRLRSRERLLAQREAIRKEILSLDR